MLHQTTAARVLEESQSVIAHSRRKEAPKASNILFRLMYVPDVIVASAEKTCHPNYFRVIAAEASASAESLESYILAVYFDH